MQLIASQKRAGLLTAMVLCWSVYVLVVLAWQTVQETPWWQSICIVK